MATKKNAPAKETSAKAPEKKDASAAQNKSLLKAYPTLTEDDLVLYDGEQRDSLLSRLAQKLNVPIEEIQEAQG